MHLHNRAKGAELSPAHEQIRRVGREIGILISADVVAPNGITAHRGRITRGDDTLQAVGLGIVRLIVAGPAAGKCASPVEAAARKEDSVWAKQAGNCSVISNGESVLHQGAGFSVRV